MLEEADDASDMKAAVVELILSHEFYRTHLDTLPQKRVPDSELVRAHSDGSGDAILVFNAPGEEAFCTKIQARLKSATGLNVRLQSSHRPPSHVIFASLRFKGGLQIMARTLQTALARSGITLVIVDAKAGTSV